MPVIMKVSLAICSIFSSLAHTLSSVITVHRPYIILVQFLPGPYIYIRIYIKILILGGYLSRIRPLLCEKVKAVTSQPSSYHGYARGLFLSDVTAISYIGYGSGLFLSDITATGFHIEWLIYDLHIY